MHATRLSNNPIITPASHPSLGTNINGPSVIRVPDWIANPLGRYYLYFAHHQGAFIRLAYADHIEGPWHIHAPGTLPMHLANFDHHIASPDVHIDHDRQRIIMFFHGFKRWVPDQHTCRAESSDGLTFTTDRRRIATFYLRAFQYDNAWFGLHRWGNICRSPDGIAPFEDGPRIYDDNARHFAVARHGDTLDVYHTRLGESPEVIYFSKINLTGHWHTWSHTNPVEILRPEMDWEGANLEPKPSNTGPIHAPANQLRDPCIYEEDGRTWLFYSIAGEQGLALAQLAPHV